MGGPVTTGSKNQRKIGGEFQSDKGYIRRQVWTDRVATDDNRLLSNQATSDSVITTVVSFLAQPDFPRNITITPGGTTADVPAGDIVVTGTNIRGEVISETFTLTADQTAEDTGLKAFKTVTSIIFPIQDGAGATYDVGIADVLGLDRMMVGDEVILATIDGTFETTRPTVVASASAIESNTIDPNTALDGSKDLVAVFVTKELTAKVGTTA